MYIEMSTETSCQDCDVITNAPLSPSQVWLEQRVVLFFRLWHMIFLCTGGVLTLVILLCCCFKCRIPRTKAEIEADFRRKKVTRKFRRELNKMNMEEIDIKDIRGVLDKVRETYHRKSSLPIQTSTDSYECLAVAGTSQSDGQRRQATQTDKTAKTRILEIFTISKKTTTKKLTKTVTDSKGNTTNIEEIISKETGKV